MGINRVFGKVKSFIKSFVEADKNSDNKKVASGLFCVGLMTKSTTSIESVMSKILGESEEVGDKLEISTKTEDKTQKQQPVKSVEKVNENRTEKSAPVTSPIKTAGEKTENNNTTSNKSKKNVKQVSEEELNKARLELRTRCIESGINYAVLVANMSALLGKTLMEFRKVDKNLQMMLIKYMQESLNRINEKNLPDVKKINAMVTDAALMFHFITHDNDGNEIDIENMAPEEISKRRVTFEQKLKIRREERMAEIEKLPESEREAAIQAMKDEFAGYRKHIFDELSKKIPYESALELILIVSVKNLGDAAKELMESYPVELREKIANTLQGYDSFREYIKAHRGECEELTPEEMEAIDQYHRIFGTYKTKENLESYEKSYVESRQNGEFSEDVLKATAMGIGEAAYANINMTSEEKETFIRNWVIDNDGLLSDADLQKVEERASQYIKELIDENPKIKENFSEVKTTIKEIVEKTLNRVLDAKKDTVNKNAPKDVQKEIIKLLSSPVGKVQSINQELLSYAHVYIRNLAKKFETPAIKKSNEEITIALLSGLIDEDVALKSLNNSEHNFIKMCVQNRMLTAMYNERIELYIKTEKNIQKLKELAEVAPYEIVIKILHNMRGDKEKFSQELVKKHEVSHDTKVLIEKYTEKEAA